MHHAVMSAYDGLIKPEQIPGYFIYLEVDPSSIDINIHPTKVAKVELNLRWSPKNSVPISFSHVTYSAMGGP